MIVPQHSERIPVEEIHNAHLWCLASLQRVLGPEKGLAFMETLSPPEVISLWLYLLDASQDADES